MFNKHTPSAKKNGQMQVTHTEHFRTKFEIVTQVSNQETVPSNSCRVYGTFNMGITDLQTPRF